MLHAVVSSDWHIGGMKKALTNPLAQQIKEIDKVYQYALKNGIQNVFVPGDIAHSPYLTEDELIALITLLLKYDKSISTYYIAGNHDIASIKKSSLDVLTTIADAGFFKNFKIYNKTTVEKIDGIEVVFLPFPNLEIPKTKRPPLVFCHIETAGCIGDNGRPLKSGHDEQLVRQKGDYLISGHIHKHQYMSSKRILYVGSLYQTNFGESLPKGWLDIKVEYKEGRRLRVDFDQIDSRPNFILETKVIQSSEDWESISEETGVRYKVLVEEGIVVPKDISQQLKNIISITGLKKSKVEMESVIETTRDLPTYKISTGLTAYLKASGCEPEVIKRAKALVKEASNSLLLN